MALVFIVSRNLCGRLELMDDAVGSCNYSMQINVIPCINSQKDAKVTDYEVCS